MVRGAHINYVYRATPKRTAKTPVSRATKRATKISLSVSIINDFPKMKNNKTPYSYLTFPSTG